MTSELDALEADARQARTMLERSKGEHTRLLKQRAEAEQATRNAQDAVENTRKVLLLLQEVGEFAREQARQQVEGLTTLALQSVFGPDYGFALESYKIGTSPAIACRVVSPYGEGDQLATEGTDSRGGGIVDLQALALRIAMLETVQPHVDGPLILDEPGKHISAEYVPLAGRFLREVGSSFNRQVIMVTHNDHLANLADRRIDVVLNDGASQVNAA